MMINAIPNGKKYIYMHINMCGINDEQKINVYEFITNRVLAIQFRFHIVSNRFIYFFYYGLCCCFGVFSFSSTFFLLCSLHYFAHFVISCICYLSWILSNHSMKTFVKWTKKQLRPCTTQTNLRTQRPNSNLGI